MKFAHLVKVSTGYTLQITASPQPNFTDPRHPVASRKEARALAAKFNAQPWNF